MMLTDYRIAPANGGKPKRVVIFLHGLGDSGSGGLLTIGQMWQRDFPDCEFVCPDAPFPFDMGPSDFGGRQWFSLQSYAPDLILEGVKAAAPILDAYIDHVISSRNLIAENIALVGFSQGTMMSLYVAPRRADPVGCVLGYSGRMLGSKTLHSEKRSTPPVFLAHGMKDEVVPFESMGLAEQELKREGIPVTTLACPSLAHSIDDAGIEKGLAFLKLYLKS